MIPVKKGDHLQYSFNTHDWFDCVVIDITRRDAQKILAKVSWSTLNNVDEKLVLYKDGTNWRIPFTNVSINTFEKYITFKQCKNIINHDDHLKKVFEHPLVTLGKCQVIMAMKERDVYEIQLFCKIDECRCKNPNLYNKTAWESFYVKKEKHIINNVNWWSLPPNHPDYEFSRKIEDELKRDQDTLMKICASTESFPDDNKASTSSYARSTCKDCGKNASKFVVLDLHPAERMKESCIVIKELVKNRICKLCKTHPDYTNKLCISSKNKFTHCMNCRFKKCKINNSLCSDCLINEELMSSVHAHHKAMFKNCIEVLVSTFGIELQVFDEQPITTLTGNPAVDTVILIKTIDGKSHLFVIEFQNTCLENPILLTHKFRHHISNFDAHRNHLMCVRITSNTVPVYRLSQKLDILRSWIIVALSKWIEFESRTFWMFFCNDSSPLQPKISLSNFMKHPIMINGAPKGVCDWEYCCDVFTIPHIAHPIVQYKLIDEYSVNVHATLYGRKKNLDFKCGVCKCAICK